MWFVYLIEVADGSYYCGIAKDVAKRVKEHASGRGSKYVAARLPIKSVLAVSGPIKSRSLAQQLEHAVKRQPKARKVDFLAFRPAGDAR